MTLLFAHLPAGCSVVIKKDSPATYVNSEFCVNQPTRTCGKSPCCLGVEDCGNNDCACKNTAVPQKEGGIL